VPIQVQPLDIELSDLVGGFAPDPEEGSLDTTSSPDLSNVVLDPGSGALELRKGFTRLSAGRLSGQSGYWIRHLNYYEVIDSGVRKRYLIAILTNGTNASTNNIKVYAYDLINDTFTRIDTAGRSWAKAKTEHWFAIAEGTYYGGTRGEEMYSWHPTDGWDANPTTPSVDTWVSSTGNSVAASGEKGKNYAFKKGMKVTYGSKYYVTLRSVRYQTWESGEHYKKGERVSRKVDHGTRTYWRSFECIQNHDAAVGNRPGDGSGTPTDYWKNIALKNIKDEDGEVTNDWAYFSVPGKSSVGAYHDHRMWVRRDDNDNWARAQYSAPAKPEKDSVIADLDWRPTDWAPADDIEGDGGGWLNIPFGKGDAIRAFISFGSYLLIFGRWQTYALAGANEQTWTLRKVGNLGAIGQSSAAEHDGLVYFISPTGSLCVTDGTATQEVEGFSKVREWTKDRIDKLMLGEDDFNWQPTVTSYGAFVFVTLPNDEGGNYTLVYHPPTHSFWKWDLPALDMAVGEAGRAQRMWFSTAIAGGGSTYPTVFKYLDDPGNETYTDDDWEGGSSTLTGAITWYWRSAWVTYGTRRMERRIRRVWGLVRSGDVVTVKTYRNFSTTAASTVNRTPVGTAEAEYVEGIKVPDSYATAVRVGGAADGQAVVHGVGIDTEPRRTRYHVGT
jgi:hypothetical protein